VKEIAVVFAIAGSLAMVGCNLLGSGEEVRDEPRRSIYRAANENPVDNPDVTPVQEKVPGESRWFWREIALDMLTRHALEKLVQRIGDGENWPGWDSHYYGKKQRFDGKFQTPFAREITSG
jgi:hypothetical protein